MYRYINKRYMFFHNTIYENLYKFLNVFQRECRTKSKSRLRKDGRS